MSLLDRILQSQIVRTVPYTVGIGADGDGGEGVGSVIPGGLLCVNGLSDVAGSEVPVEMSWWVGGGIPWPTTPVVAASFHIGSTSDQDDSGGSGAVQIKVVYLDSDWVLQSALVSLNGWEYVSGGVDFLRILGAQVVQAGAGGVNVGDVSLAHLDDTKALSDLQQTNPCTAVTASAHGLVTGELVRLDSNVGWTYPTMHNRLFRITYVNDTTFTLDGLDATGFDPWDGSGDVHSYRTHAVIPAGWGSAAMAHTSIPANVADAQLFAVLTSANTDGSLVVQIRPYGEGWQTVHHNLLDWAYQKGCVGIPHPLSPRTDIRVFLLTASGPSTKFSTKLAVQLL